MAERVFKGDHECDGEGQGTPADLYVIPLALLDLNLEGLRGVYIARTAVIVSMHNTNGSEFMYLESENAYSFHSWPNRSCLPGMLA